MRIVINLEVETENFEDLEEDQKRELVYTYLQELIEDDSLEFELEDVGD